MKRCHGEVMGCRGFPAKCSEFCIGYIQLQNIYALSNMPERYQYELPLTNPGKDRDSYMKLKEFQENVADNVNSGRGVFLYSDKKGNGKTTWACKIMNEYFKKVALLNNLRCRGLFIPVPKFMQDLRNQMNEETRSERIAEIEEDLWTADLVIWDDIGCEMPTDWVRERLYAYINHRESNGLSQIFTSNVHLRQLRLETNLGERIVSRIKGQCEIYEFFENDRRGTT